MTLELLDVIAKLLSAAKTAPDASVRVIYLAEARVQLEAARARFVNLDSLIAAAEEEVARVVAAEKDQRAGAAPRMRQERAADA